MSGYSKTRYNDSVGIFGWSLYSSNPGIRGRYYNWRSTLLLDVGTTIGGKYQKHLLLLDTVLLLGILITIRCRHRTSSNSGPGATIFLSKGSKLPRSLKLLSFKAYNFYVFFNIKDLGIVGLLSTRSVQICSLI